MEVLENNNGYVTQVKECGIKTRILSNKVYLGKFDSKTNWKLISKEEGDKLLSLLNIVKDINTVEDLDKIIESSSILDKVINDIPMSNKESLKRKQYYPKWETFIGKILPEDFKVLYKNSLYKVVLEHTVLELYFPSINTASLYEEINEIHEGTLEDPIPYNNNMRLELNKFYIQKELIYKCIRDSEIPVYQDLSELVDIYVELIK